MKYLKEETLAYMNNIWRFSGSDSFDDMLMFWEMGFFEATAKLLVNAGAVEPNCKEAKDMIKVAKSIKPREFQSMFKQCLNEYFIAHCIHCDHMHFISHFYEKENIAIWNCDSCAKKGLKAL